VHVHALNVCRASATLLKRFSCSSSREITLMLAGASVIFCSKPEALTTVSLSVSGLESASV